MNSPLPFRLGALLSMAISDAMSLDESKYTLNMGLWYLPASQYGGNNLRCHVCLAGAVMVKRLECASRYEMTPANFDAVISGQLKAINALRNGYTIEASRHLTNVTDTDMPETPEPDNVRKLAWLAGENSKHPENNGWKAHLDYAQALTEVGL